MGWRGLRRRRGLRAFAGLKGGFMESFVFKRLFKMWPGPGRPALLVRALLVRALLVRALLVRALLVRALLVVVQQLRIGGVFRLHDG
jgi:hypothetical protein